MALRHAGCRIGGGTSVTTAGRGRLRLASVAPVPSRRLDALQFGKIKPADRSQIAAQGRQAHTGLEGEVELPDGLQEREASRSDRALDAGLLAMGDGRWEMGDGRWEISSAISTPRNSRHDQPCVCARSSNCRQRRRVLAIDYPEKNEMPKFVGNLFPHKQIALQTSA